MLGDANHFRIFSCIFDGLSLCVPLIQVSFLLIQLEPSKPVTPETVA